MRHHYLQPAFTLKPCCSNVRFILDRQCMAPCKACKRRPHGDPQRDHCTTESAAENTCDRNRYHHLREREEHIRDLQDYGVEPLSLVADVHAQRHADDRSAQRAAQPDDDTDPPAVQHARPDVASHLIRAEDVLGIRARYSVAQRDLRRAPLGKQGCCKT